MPRKKKSWQEKLADAKAKPGLPKKWYCDKAKQRFVIAHPDEIERIIRGVRRGKLITMHKKVKANSGMLKFCNIRPEIFEVFAITRLDRLFDIKKDEEEGLAAF